MSEVTFRKDNNTSRLAIYIFVNTTLKMSP